MFRSKKNNISTFQYQNRETYFVLVPYHRSTKNFRRLLTKQFIPLKRPEKPQRQIYEKVGNMQNKIQVK